MRDRGGSHDMIINELVLEYSCWSTDNIPVLNALSSSGSLVAAVWLCINRIDIYFVVIEQSFWPKPLIPSHHYLIHPKKRTCAHTYNLSYKRTAIYKLLHYVTILSIIWRGNKASRYVSKMKLGSGQCLELEDRPRWAEYLVHLQHERASQSSP